MPRTDVRAPLAPADAAAASRRASFALLFALLGLCLAISGLPSPLYDSYQREWGFSPLTLTVVFAVYAIAALAALLVVGKLSDSIGRKPVLIVAQLMLLGGLVLFIEAKSAGWLMAARALHGAAIGSVAATAGAALLDIRPRHGTLIGRFTGIALTFGMTAGVLGGAILGQYAPHPHVTPYLVVGAAVLLTLGGTVAMPEPLTARKPLVLKQLEIRPRVPAEISDSFWFTAVSTAATWAVLGLYLSLVPGLASRDAHSVNLMTGGTIVAALIGTAAVVQLFTHRISALRLAIAGDLILTGGLVLSVLAAAAHSTWAIYLTAVVMGIGLGPSFNGSLRHLSGVIPGGQRGQVMSAYYLVGYLSMAIPAILAGLAASHVGLTPTYVAFGIVVAVVCAGAAWLGSRIAARTR
ncbi:MAG TPA: MFS transporter [Streptosporangiaceae bacterium]|nr:MFS transporter [Streptosporangiaceae bacterium]